MSRRKRALKRQILPDPKYGSVDLTWFVNSILRRGKRSTAESILYGALDIIKAKGNENPLEIFEKGIKNAEPVVEVKSRRVGGSTYQVPVEVKPQRRRALATRWVLLYAGQRGEKTMSQKLAAELIAAAKGEGGSIKKRDDTHKMAEANKAFAHFRW